MRLYELGKKYFYASAYGKRLTWLQSAYLWVWCRIVGRHRVW